MISPDQINLEQFWRTPKPILWPHFQDLHSFSFNLIRTFNFGAEGIFLFAILRALEGALANRATLGEPTFHVHSVSLENALKHLHAGHWVTRLPGAPCLLAQRHPSRRVFLLCKRVSQLAESRRPRKNGGTKLPSWGIVSLLSLTTALDTERRLLAKQVVKKHFFCPPSCLLCLAAAQKIAHRPSCSGELPVKAGYILTLLAG